ncbi:hypothetical protein [Streptomyces pseudovenezuelae]|uniref:hypothetical protein n=1 Tax=Streptomyces pseudovenezuelae TaxID=67350 RepID=UPI003718F5B1
MRKRVGHKTFQKLLSGTDKSRHDVFVPDDTGPTGVENRISTCARLNGTSAGVPPAEVPFHVAVLTDLLADGAPADGK